MQIGSVISQLLACISHLVENLLVYSRSPAANVGPFNQTKATGIGNNEIKSILRVKSKALEPNKVSFCQVFSAVTYIRIARETLFFMVDSRNITQIVSMCKWIAYGTLKSDCINQVIVLLHKPF